MRRALTLLLALFAVVSGCEERRDASTPAATRSAPSETSSIQSTVALVEEDAIAWWKAYVDQLNVNPLSERDDPCKDCTARVPAAFLADRDLADRARRDVQQDASPLISCGTVDNSRFTDTVAIVQGTVDGLRTTIGSGVLVDDGKAVLTAWHVWERIKNDTERGVVVSSSSQDKDKKRFYTITRKRAPQSRNGPDLVVLELDRAVEVPYSKHDINRDRGVVAKGKRIVVAGFGPDPQRGDAKGRRRIVNVHVAQAPCVAGSTPDYGCIASYEFVASDALRSGAPCDSCDYDSGGPAYLEHPRGSGKWLIIGIVRGGVPDDKAKGWVPPCTSKGSCGCGGIYTFADEYFDLK